MSATSTLVSRLLNKTGVIRATQTLMQLAQGYEGVPEIEPVSITDWPAFKVRGFGMMLAVLL